MTDHPVTRYKEDFFIHLQSVFSRTDAYQDNKKPHRSLLETKLLKTQVQYQGNSAWLKRNKQEIQSLKTTITQHFHLNSLTASWLLQHTKDLSCIGCLFLGLQLKQLYAQITHKYRAPLSSTPHTRSHSKRHLVPSQLVWCSQREPHTSSQECIKLSGHIIAWLRLSQLGIHSHWQVSLASNFSVTN